MSEFFGQLVAFIDLHC